MSEELMDGAWTTLGELDEGAIFETAEGIRAVKSEYHLSSGQCLCILLASGEYAHFPERHATPVREIRLSDEDHNREALSELWAVLFGEGQAPENWLAEVQALKEAAAERNEAVATAMACQAREETKIKELNGWAEFLVQAMDKVRVDYMVMLEERDEARAALQKIVNHWGNLHSKDRQQARAALGLDPITPQGEQLCSEVGHVLHSNRDECERCGVTIIVNEGGEP